jgi:hypothetical protein
MDYELYPYKDILLMSLVFTYQCILLYLFFLYCKANQFLNKYFQSWP